MNTVNVGGVSLARYTALFANMYVLRSIVVQCTIVFGNPEAPAG